MRKSSRLIITPTQGFKIVVKILLILLMAIAMRSAYNWIHAVLPGDLQELENWTTTQSSRDPKWAWDVPALGWAKFFCGVLIVVVWGIFYTYALQPLLSNAVSHKRFGRPFGLILGVILACMLVIGAGAYYEHFMAEFAGNVLDFRGIKQWMYSPGSDPLPWDEAWNYLYYVFAPSAIMMLAALSCIWCPVKESFLYTKKELKKLSKAKAS